MTLGACGNGPAEASIYGHAKPTTSEIVSTVTLIKKTEVIATAKVDRDGTYSFRNVLPGRYRLEASTTAAAGAEPCDPGAACLIPPATSETREVDVVQDERHEENF
jgi:hypothetical protein